jgi:hypothetical protein
MIIAITEAWAASPNWVVGHPSVTSSTRSNYRSRGFLLPLVIIALVSACQKQQAERTELAVPSRGVMSSDSRPLFTGHRYPAEGTEVGTKELGESCRETGPQACKDKGGLCLHVLGDRGPLDLDHYLCSRTCRTTMDCGLNGWTCSSISAAGLDGHASLVCSPSKAWVASNDKAHSQKKRVPLP